MLHVHHCDFQAVLFLEDFPTTYTSLSCWTRTVLQHRRPLGVIILRWGHTTEGRTSHNYDGCATRAAASSAESFDRLVSKSRLQGGFNWDHTTTTEEIKRSSERKSSWYLTSISNQHFWRWVGCCYVQPSLLFFRLDRLSIWTVILFMSAKSVFVIQCKNPAAATVCTLMWLINLGGWNATDGCGQTDRRKH